MDPESLIILDYSGTLSIEAPRFARPEHLEEQLAACGLADFGIDRADRFWEEIVNPTWEEGSTTARGYMALITDRVMKRLGRKTNDGAIVKAAACFVRRYLEASAIDPRWKPLFTWLQATPGVLPVIATDHYAEATDAIIAHLRESGIPGMALHDRTANSGREGAIIVANSADLGVHKACRPFWKIVETRLPLKALRRVLIVDDFGAHEQSGDAYGAPGRIALRRQRTVDLLAGVFGVPVATIDFVWNISESSGAADEAFDDLFAVTICRIRDFMSGNHEPIQRQPHQ